MTLVRLKPGREFLRDSMIPQNMMRAIDDMFNESLGKFERSVHFSPRTDVVEKDDRFELHINLPGTKKEDVKIEVDADVLTISGERKFVKEADNKYHTVESFYGSFSRSFTLPENADKEKIEASMNDGILKVYIFKSEVKQTKTSVVIKSVVFIVSVKAGYPSDSGFAVYCNASSALFTAVSISFSIFA